MKHICEFDLLPLKLTDHQQPIIILNHHQNKDNHSAIVGLFTCNFAITTGHSGAGLQQQHLSDLWTSVGLFYTRTKGHYNNLRRQNE